MEDPNVNKVFLPSVIFPKLKSTSKFPVIACTSCLLARSKNDQLEPRNRPLSLKNKASYLVTSISLDIFPLQTSLWLISQVNCLMDMYESILLIYFMQAPFTMMPLPVLFGFKIRYPQEPGKPSQGGSVLNNGFGSKYVFRYLTCTVTTLFLNLINFVWTVTKNINRNLPLELDHSIRTQEHKQ